MKSLAAALLVAAQAAAAGPPPPSAPLLGAYKDVTVAVDAASTRIGTAAGPLPAAAGRYDVVVWSFATGRCGSESWSGIDADRFAAANVAAFAAAGQRYVLSTGGQAGVFSCDSDAGIERFIARHASPQLAGVDFDIEGAQSDAEIDDLVRVAAGAAKRHPELTFTFTLATHGGTRGVNRTGERVLAALARHRFDTAIVNLMVMDYGPASAEVCVVRDGRCDMAASALQAARNAMQAHALAPARIALTAMVGVNDVVENVLSTDDARRLAHDAREAGLAAVFTWSLDRDAPCAGAPVRPDCSSLGGARGDYARALNEGLGRR